MTLVVIPDDGPVYTFHTEDANMTLNMGIKETTTAADRWRTYEPDAAGNYWTINAHGREMPERDA